MPIIVGGDSAGGNLSAIMAQRSRDRGGPPIAFQALIYPVTDADLDNASYTAEENQLMLSRDSMVWFWDHYLPDADTPVRDRRLAAAGEGLRRAAAGRSC